MLYLERRSLKYSQHWQTAKVPSAAKTTCLALACRLRVLGKPGSCLFGLLSKMKSTDTLFPIILRSTWETRRFRSQCNI